MTITLALDISSASTGVCVFDDSSILYNENIVLKKKTHAERLYVFETKVKELIKQYKPSDIVLEDCWRGRNIKTFKILSLYHGVAYKICYETLKKDPILLMPSEARRILGNAAGINLLPSKKISKALGVDSKELTFNLIKSLYKLDTYTFEKNNDQTDAIAVGLAYNLSKGYEHARSIFSARASAGGVGGRSQESLQKTGVPVSPRQKPRRQSRRRKV